MHLNEFQANLIQFQTVVDPEKRSLVNFLGLCGEAGEIIEKYKKSVRDGHPMDTDDLIKELGDVLYYVAEKASDIGVGLDTVAAVCLNKLHSRKARGKLNGAGDDR